MYVRNKITIIIITTMVLIALLSRIELRGFFTGYLQKQEEIQVNTIRWNLESFLIEKLDKYEGVLNDWAHWDDTYNYMNNNYIGFKDENLNEDTFVNLDISFVIVVEKNDLVKSKQYYNFDNKNFEEFPSNIGNQLDEIIKLSKINEDNSGILKLGDDLYFITSSDITDSMKTKEEKGKLIFGRLIDKGMVTTLERITEGTIEFSTTLKIDMNSSNLLGENLKRESDEHSLHIISSKRSRNFMDIEFVSRDAFNKDYYVLIKLSKARGLFLGGMRQINRFILSYIGIMILIMGVVFALLGKYISKPFTKLIGDVKAVDLTTNEIEKLEVHGKDEFAFLRTSINNMLSRIEVEQYKVRENREQLYAILTSVGEGVIAVDKDKKISFMNEVAEQLTGWENDEANGEALEKVFKIINGYTREKVDTSLKNNLETEVAFDLDSNRILISRDGSEREIEDTISPIKDKHGNIMGMVLVFKDCSDKNEKRREIEFLSYHDQLTGLYNRRYFEKQLNLLNNKKNLPITIVFGDVNGLKTINDAFGHKYGDILLKQVSQVFKEEFREGHIIARTGGDEFIILLPKTEKSDAKRLVDSVKEKLKEKSIMNIITSVSFGLDTKSQADMDVWEVLRNAEDHMYERKIFHSSSKRSEVIRSILNTLYLKTPREDAHSKRVSVICEAIGKEYNLPDDEVKELKLAGELHDIGKIAVDEIVLDKPGKLTKEEWEQIQRHPEIGYRLLATSNQYYSIAEYVLAHHEKWNGTGYPRGLKGEKIPWKARIICIADAFDAMTCERPYRNPLTEEEAIEEIKKGAGGQFDPDIARVFVEKVLGTKW